MVALHRPFYKVSFNFGGSRGLDFEGSSPSRPTLTYIVVKHVDQLGKSTVREDEYGFVFFSTEFRHLFCQPVILTPLSLSQQATETATNRADSNIATKYADRQGLTMQKEEVGGGLIRDLPFRNIQGYRRGNKRTQGETAKG